jgi:hypothetical protein
MGELGECRSRRARQTRWAAPMSRAGGRHQRLEQEAAPGGEAVAAWQRTVATHDGSAERKVKFGQSNLEVILQGTTALFLFLQVHFFSGCPPNLVLEDDFAGNRCS